MIGRLFSLPVILVLTALGIALMFVFWQDSMRWAWERLGFAWTVAVLWPLAFLLVMRYRTAWIGVYWRDWVGSAFFSLGAIGLLSLFTLDRWWLGDATLAGYWGTALGGEPFSQKSLGILKVVVLFAVVPPIISPRLAGGMYKSGAIKTFLALRAVFRWSKNTAIPAMVAAVRSAPKPDRVALRLKVIYRSVSRSLFRREAVEEPAAPMAVSVNSHVDDGDATPVASINGAAAKHTPKIFGWHLPTTELLAKPEAAVQQAPPNDLSEQITSTLRDHGIDVSIKNVKVGPRVIQFGLEPGWVSKGQGQ